MKPPKIYTADDFRKIPTLDMEERFLIKQLCNELLAERLKPVYFSEEETGHIDKLVCKNSEWEERRQGDTHVMWATEPQKLEPEKACDHKGFNYIEYEIDYAKQALYEIHPSEPKFCPKCGTKLTGGAE